MKKILLALLFLFGSEVHAKDLGVYGETYEIREPSMLQQIQEKLKEAQKTGKINELQKYLEKQAENSLNRPAPISTITTAEVSREWYYDPSISLKNDLKDQLGRVFYKAGTKVNPLDKISLSKVLLFINGDDQKQVEWALKIYNDKKGKAKIILTDGAVLDLMRKSKVRIYFDQQGVLTTKFGIKHVPASLEQHNKLLLIREVKL